MTAATEGRTYMIKSLVLHPDIASGKRRPTGMDRGIPYETAADYIEAETPYVVPNGKWVASWPSACWAKLVGADWSEIESVKLDTRYGGTSVYSILYICDKPFGFIAAEEGDYPTTHPKGRLLGDLKFHSAQQVHKSELTQSGVPFPKLTLVREAEGLDRKMWSFQRNRSQRRNHTRWARLTDVMIASDRTVEEIILSYWRFIGRSIDHENDRHGTFLHVTYGSPEEVASHDRKVLYYSQDELGPVINSGPARVWVRAGFAKTILQLLSLGVTPEFLQTV